METVGDYELKATKILSDGILGYYNTGAADMNTLKDNCDAYKRWKFRPRVLRDVVNVDTSTTVLGYRIPFPICIAPTALHEMAHSDGEIATARAAEKLGIGMALSMWSNKTLEEVAESAPKCLSWCHMQICASKEFMKHFIERAEENGYSGLVITVDQPDMAQQRKKTIDDALEDPKLRSLQKSLQAINIPRLDVTDTAQVQRFFFGSPSEWTTVDWIRSVTKLPIILKGILTGEMACEALDHKVDGILVSNHGGRQLDGTFATIDVLSEVVDAVKGRCDVYLDGGIRKGSDVAKAIALGAKAVFVGRPVLWGLACEGEDGARRVLEILRDELIITMKLLGVNSIQEIQTVPNLVVHETYYSKLFR